jgi:hypothetical protein
LPSRFHETDISPCGDGILPIVNKSIFLTEACKAEMFVATDKTTGASPSPVRRRHVAFGFR